MPIKFKILLLAMLLGSFGVVARYVLHEAMKGTAFPWSTLIVNAVGSFAMGALYAYAKPTASEPNVWMIAIGVGFLGALTTFSSFSLDTLKLVEVGNWMGAILNVTANNVVSLGCCYLAYAIVRGSGAY